MDCPFCGEGDFSAILLKHHLLEHCKEFRAILTVKQERERILAERDALRDSRAKIRQERGL